MTAAPPPTSLSLGNVLRLRPEDSVLVTESSGTAPATLVIYARGRDETNGQQIPLAASCAIPLDGKDVGGVVLNAGAASYVFGPREAPVLPGGSTVNVNVSDPRPLPVVPVSSSGNAYPKVWTGGGNAPDGGIWHVAIQCTTGGVAISIGGAPVWVGVLATDLVAGTVYYVNHPVTGGVAYPVTGGTVVNGFISGS